MNMPPETSVGFCPPEEIGKVQKFLHDHWAENHVLATDHTLIDWQHKDMLHNRYNFVIAQQAGDEDLCGILGFISTRQLDPALARSNTIWLTTWMVRPDMRKSALGMKLLGFLTKNEPAVHIGTVGNNAEVAGVYAALRYKTGTLNRHAIVNRKLSSYRLVKHRGLPDTKNIPATGTLRHLSRGDLANSHIAAFIENSTPHKTPAYVIGRYLEHPVYKYDIYALFKAERPQAIIVTRVCEAETASALRIVDFYGREDALPSLSSAVQTLIERDAYEYADFYNDGLDSDAFLKTNFFPVENDGGLVLPNYFEPLTPSNTQIRFAFKSEHTSFRLFKADADQDRPNRTYALTTQKTKTSASFSA